MYVKRHELYILIVVYRNTITMKVIAFVLCTMIAFCGLGKFK